MIRVDQLMSCSTREGSARQVNAFHKSVTLAICCGVAPATDMRVIAGYQRRAQRPPHPPPQRPPPPTSLIINRSISAPIVALMIAAIMPEPRWMPSWAAATRQ